MPPPATIRKAQPSAARRQRVALLPNPITADSIAGSAEISTGDSDAASLDLLLIGRLAESIATEPFLPSQHTRRLLLGLFACVKMHR